MRRGNASDHPDAAKRPECAQISRMGIESNRFDGRNEEYSEAGLSEAPFGYHGGESGAKLTCATVAAATTTVATTATTATTATAAAAVATTATAAAVTTAAAATTTAKAATTRATAATTAAAGLLTCLVDHQAAAF